MLIDPYVWSIKYKNVLPVRVLIVVFLGLALFYFAKSRAWNHIREFFDYRTLEGKLAVTLLFLTLIRLLSLLVAHDKATAIEMNIFWISVIGVYFTLWILLKNNVITRQFLKKLLLVLYLSSLASIVVGILQMFYFIGWGKKLWDVWIIGGYPDKFRITGLSNDPNHYGVVAILAVALAIYFLYKNKSKISYVANSVAIAISTIGVFYSGSKSAFVAFIILIALSLTNLLLNKLYLTLFITSVALAAGYLGYSWIGYELRTGCFVVTVENVCIWNIPSFQLTTAPSVPNKIAFVGTVPQFLKGLLPAVTAPSVPLTTPTIKKNSLSNVITSEVTQSRNVAYNDSSTSAHLLFVKGALEIGLHHPLLGVGYGNFSDAFVKTATFKEFSKYDAGVAQGGGKFPSHTLWGENLAETGIPGFLVFAIVIMLISLIIARSWVDASDKEEKVLLGSGLAFIIAVQAFSVVFALNKEFYWLFMFILVLLASHLYHSKKKGGNHAV
jgi:hypothetical protein